MQCFFCSVLILYSTIIPQIIFKTFKTSWRCQDFSIRSAWLVSIYYFQFAKDCMKKYKKSSVNSVYRVSSPHCCLSFNCCFFSLTRASKFWFLWQKLSFSNWDFLKFSSNSWLQAPEQTLAPNCDVWSINLLINQSMCCISLLQNDYTAARKNIF